MPYLRNLSVLQSSAQAVLFMLAPLASQPHAGCTKREYCCRLAAELRAAVAQDAIGSLSLCQYKRDAFTKRSAPVTDGFLFFAGSHEALLGCAGPPGMPSSSHAGCPRGRTPTAWMQRKRAANMQSAIQKLLLCHDKHAFGAHAALKVGQLPHQIRRHVECTNRNAQRKVQ